MQSAIAASSPSRVAIATRSGQHALIANADIGRGEMVVAVTGGLASPAYPLLYGLVAFAMTVLARPGALVTLGASLLLEAALLVRTGLTVDHALAAGLHVVYLGGAAVAHVLLLRGLTAIHDIGAAFTDEDYGSTAEAREQLSEARRKNPPVVHPVVRTHPVTRRAGIFVNASFTTRICELSKSESAALLQFLAAHVAKPEFTVRWRWKPFDLAFWDNRLTQHYATADYMPYRRVMHRATILGDRPR
jgi:taurine dioxygenase